MRCCTTCAAPLAPDAWTNVVCSPDCVDVWFAATVLASAPALAEA